MDSRHIYKISSILLIFTLMLLSIKTVDLKADGNIDYIFIGDSRFVGMANAKGVNCTKTEAQAGSGKAEVITQSGNIYWCAKGSTHIAKGDMDIDGAIAKGTKGSTIIVYELGVNGLSNISKDIEYCNKLADDGWTVYMCDILPVDSDRSSYGYLVKEAEIVEANKKIYSGAGKYKVIKFHDECDASKAPDGLHYDSDTYTKWYSKIMSTATGTGSGDSSTETKTDDSKEFREALKTCLGHEPSDKEVYNYSYMISFLKTDGLNDIAVAGVLGNILHEGSNVYAIEGYYGEHSTEEGATSYATFEDGKTYHFTDEPYYYTYDNGGKIGGIGHGIVQWSFGLADNLFTFAKENADKCGFTYVSCYHYFRSDTAGIAKWDWAYIPDILGQVQYFVTTSEYQAIKDDLNSQTTPESASTYFCQNYEKPANPDYTERGNSAKLAYEMIKVHKGTIGTAKDNVEGVAEDVENNIGMFMLSGGYWSEQDLQSYCKLNELNIDEMLLSGASKENLTQSEIDAVAQWQDNITSHPILKAFRTLVVLLGILLTVWSVLFYICYWLQRVNNFIEIDFITLLSFGRFQLADEDTQVTYGLSKQKSEKGKTLINHRAVIKICVVTILVGTLMITGLIYKLLVFVIHAITGKLRF